MILPFPVEPREVFRLPITGTLLLLNVLIFFLLFSGVSSRIGTSRILESESMTLTGRLYYQYQKQLPEVERRSQPTWLAQMKLENPEHMEVLGSFALRDKNFLEAAEKMSFSGDQVAIADWRKELGEFRSRYFAQILFKFGLSSLQAGPLSWVTYQFSHSGVIHLLSNMVFFVVMGAAVEMYFGSMTLLLVYLLGGFAGGFSFLLMNAHGTIPMVGASASVSALLAFYSVMELRPRIRFAYFISPLAGQYGFIYLPTLLIIPLFLLVDVSSLISTPEGIGSGVAYSAHLGGSILGLIFGGVWRLKKILTGRSTTSSLT